MKSKKQEIISELIDLKFNGGAAGAGSKDQGGPVCYIVVCDPLCGPGCTGRCECETCGCD